MTRGRRGVGAAAVAGLIAAIVVSALILVISGQGSPGGSTTLSPNPGGSSSLRADCPSFTASSGTTNSSAAQVEIVSVKLVNTTVGSHIVFDVTFKNVGNSTIYYASYDGRTTPVYASVYPCSPSPISPATTVTDEYGCMRTISAVELAPGGTGSALTTDCVSPASYEITSPGVIYAVITMTWSSNASSMLSEHPESTSISQTFSIG